MSTPYGPFPAHAPVAFPLFYRSYSRRDDAGGRESWSQVVSRNLQGLVALGQLTKEEADLLLDHQLRLTALPSGRWLWVGGTDWAADPRNFYGAYNCASLHLDHPGVFGMLMNLAMQGTGTGAVISKANISRLPVVANRIKVKHRGQIGAAPPERRGEDTMVTTANFGFLEIKTGDSRKGWVSSYQKLIDAAFDPLLANGELVVTVDLSWVRPSGERLKGFGGTANPVALPEMYERVAKVLNGAVGRKLTALECCLLIDEAARCVVAGNIRRSAGMRQFDADDASAAGAKNNLWVQDEAGTWSIDPERDALRMANHTRLFLQVPTLEEVTESVRSQHACGEGAIQFVPETLVRSNADVLGENWIEEQLRDAIEEDGLQGAARFLSLLLFGARDLEALTPEQRYEIDHRISRFGLNPCGEINGADFLCVDGSTQLITRSGLAPIRELTGQVVEIWNGVRWSEVMPFQTGRGKRLYRVTFSDGTYLDTTDRHAFYVKDRFQESYSRVETRDLMAYSRYSIHTEPFRIDYEDGENIDCDYAYTLGVMIGDGSFYPRVDPSGEKRWHPQLALHGDKRLLPVACEIGSSRQLPGHGVPTCYVKGSDLSGLGFTREMIRRLRTSPEAIAAFAGWSRKAILSLVAGLADTDGSETGTGGIRIYISDRGCAYTWLLLLLKCGIRSSLCLMARSGHQTNKGTRKRDLWYLQITDCQDIPCHRLDTSKGHQPTSKGRYQVVRSVEELPGLHDTYCFTEPEHHKGVFGASLTGQCNLAEVHLNQVDPADTEDVNQAFRAAAVSVCALLHHRFHDERMRRSREIDPIVGVSFTGLFDYFVRLLGIEWLDWWAEGRPPHARGQHFSCVEHLHLRRFRSVVEDQVRDYCTRHGLRIPNRCTTVQPAGCLTMEAVRTTDQGILLLDELERVAGLPRLQGLPTTDLTARNGTLVTDLVMNSPLAVVCITLNSGRQITATYDHRFAVHSPIGSGPEPVWVKASCLCEGDWLATAPAAPYEGRDLLLPEIASRLKVLPPAPNHELGYFVGVLLGRNAMKVTLPGHKHKEGSMLCMSFPEGLAPVAARFRKVAVSLFNLTFTRAPRGKQLFLHSSEVRLIEWLSSQGLLLVEHPEVDRLPLVLRRSSRETLIGFLAALVDTTSLRARHKSLSIKLAHEPMARHLQQVAEAVGLVFSIKQITNRDEPYWLLTLSRFWSHSDSLELLGRFSVLAASRGCTPVKRDFGRDLFRVAKVEQLKWPRITGDISVAGATDDDHWYWQGAIKSHNSKSLLTNASPGWHPPKATFYIRRITFAKDDPIALACLDYGYTIVPSQSDKDENGRLLDDPFDPRCTEWLVEIPTAAPWALMEGAEHCDPSKFSALAQFDFYMQVQRSYTTFNTSATLELTGEEVQPLAKAIHASMEAGTGYISAALLARPDDKETYPRMPFEAVDKETFLRLCREVDDRRTVSSFDEALRQRDAAAGLFQVQEHGPAACDGAKCLMP
jgi:hypothetical protein